MFLKILILLTFCLLMPLVSANMAINIEPNNPTLNLNHGQSQQITFIVSNSNEICSLSCSWTLIKGNSAQINSGSQTTPAGVSFSIPITFTAPTKLVSKQDSGSEEYLFGLDCRTVTSITCWSNDKVVTTSTVTLNYDLTSDEKSAKNYLQNSLSSISALLKISESTSYTINSKLSLLPKSVLITDLKNQLTTYYSDYFDYKNNYDSIITLYDALSYAEAKNSFNSNLQSSLTQLNNNLNSLSTAIDARIKLHNEVTDKLNKLKEASAKLKLKAKLLGQDVSTLSSQIDSLDRSFLAGSFTSYSNIQEMISSFDGQITSESSILDKNIFDIIRKGNAILPSEFSKLNLSTQYSMVSTNDIEGIKSVCSQLSSIKSAFEQENSKKTNGYNLALAAVHDYNQNLDRINSNIKRINELRLQISLMVNKDHIKDEDYSACQDELLKLSTFNYTQFIGLTLESASSCLTLNETLSNIRATREGFFTFKVMRFFRGLWPFDSVRFEEIKPLEKKENQPGPELLDFTMESKEFNSHYCELDLDLSIQNIGYVADVVGARITNSNVGGITEHENQCCSFEICSKCCEGDECMDDQNSYPVIFLHGHSFKEADSPEYSLDAFTNLQLALLSDKYRIGGVFRPSDQYSSMNQGEWGKVRFPITVKATYYYNTYNSEGKMINAPSKQESIDIYAQRLKEVVERVKYRTGRDKVNIVAHSMGGLVARDYIKNYGGDASVNKLIMIGTPNHGIYNVVDSLCAVTGADTECAQMKADNHFILNLNSGDETYGSVKYYTIAGTGCSLGTGLEADGIVRADSVKLDGAMNVKVDGKCEGTFNRDFHSNLLSSNKYPQTYSYIKQFLQE